MAKKATRQKAKGKPQKPSIKIPTSPSSASKITSAALPDNVISAGSNSNLASAFHTPSTSPSTLATELPSMDSALPKQFETQEGKSDNDKVEEQAQVELPSPDEPQQPIQVEIQDGNENEKPEEQVQDQILSPDQSLQPTQEEPPHLEKDPEQQPSPAGDTGGPQPPSEEHEELTTTPEQEEESQPQAGGEPQLEEGEPQPEEGEPQLQAEEEPDPQPTDQEPLQSSAPIQQEPELSGEGKELSSPQEQDDPNLPIEDPQPTLAEDEESQSPMQAPEPGEGQEGSSSPQEQQGGPQSPTEEPQPALEDNEQSQSPVQALEPGEESELSSSPQEQEDPQLPTEEPQPALEEKEQLKPPVEAIEPGEGLEPSPSPQEQEDPQLPTEEPQPTFGDHEQLESPLQPREGPYSPTQGQEQSPVLAQEPEEFQTSSQKEEEEEAQISLQDDPEQPPQIELRAPTPTQEQRPKEEQAEPQDLQETEYPETPLQEDEEPLEQDKYPDDGQQQSPEPEPEPELDIDLSMQQQSPTETCGSPISAITASDVASKDIMAIAGVLSTMKTALVSMANAFDRLGDQTEKMAKLALDLKAAEQIRRLKSVLEQQITKHKVEVELLQSSLKTKIKEAVEEKIRTELINMVRESVQQEVEEKVRYQLSIQIPEDLRQQVISHKRQILEVKTTLHNSEARRHNALQTIPGPHARLRPLLRPLPTPEQSPIILMSRSSSMDPSTLPTPATAFPQVPAPTPIKRVSSSSLRSALVPETVPPTPSRLFPRDLTALFALSQDEARRLLREYGLDSATASPTKENARPRALSIVTEESTDSVHDEDPAAHARDLNKFMAHIGVPFLMIPAPQEKFSQSAPLSSKSRRKLLTPLIIK